MSGRRYNTSCEACRKARMGCDAVLQRPNPCTNCVRREKDGKRASPSTTQAIYHTTTSSLGDFSDNGVAPFPQPRYLMQTGSPLSPVSMSISRSDLDNSTTRRTRAMALHHLLWDIFVSIWDSRAALWLSTSCNPFLETKVGQNSLISRLMLESDSYLKEYQDARGGTERLRSVSRSSSRSPRHVETDPTLDDCLRYAVYAYASKWLPLRSAFQITRGVSRDKAQEMEQEVRDHIWRRARGLMYAAMARPCYRSILALFLFAFAEMPMGNNDYGFNHLCSEVLFSHFNYMRSTARRVRGRPLSEYSTVAPSDVEWVDSPWSKEGEDSDGTLEHAQNCIFWLGVISDSTRSLIHQSPSILLPGRSGDEKVWNLIRRRNVIFDRSFRRLHDSQVPLSPDVTNVVLQAALASKIMHYGMLNQFFDAAFYTTTESIEEAAKRVLDESQLYHDTLGPLLNKCAQDYSSMKVENQLNYTLVCAHYHMGTLILADALDRLDTVPAGLRNPRLSRLYACNAVINAISLALNYDRYSEDQSSYESILLRDPTPITMVETLSLTYKAVFLLLEKGEINLPTAQMMVSVVVTGLTVLSRILVTATLALESLRHRCASNGKLKFRADNHTSSSTREDPATVELLGMCDRDFIDEFLQEMKLVEMSDDCGLLDRTIAKHENPVVNNDRVAHTPLFPSEIGLDDSASACEAWTQ